MALVKKILQSSKIIWLIFGNDEDPEPPEWFMPSENENWREFCWFFVRNPLHNFCSYKGKKFEGYFGFRPKSDGSQIFGIAFRRKKD